MKAKATVRLKLLSQKKLETVLRSLEPEVNTPAAVRSKASLARGEGFLILEVQAKDTVALRATLNAYLRWINSILNVFDAVERYED
jgi:tRNA threonylcarbamoyladenosine modification (KEOPS) complex  Pcc1 subunit